VRRLSIRCTGPFLMRPVYGWNYDAQGLEQTKDLFDGHGINYLRLPAGVVPVYLMEGLPAGVQLVGRRFREDVILDAMAAFEQRAGLLVKQLWARQKRITWASGVDFRPRATQEASSEGAPGARRNPHQEIRNQTPR